MAINRSNIDEKDLHNQSDDLEVNEETLVEEFETAIDPQIEAYLLFDMIGFRAKVGNLTFSKREESLHIELVNLYETNAVTYLSRLSNKIDECMNDLLVKYQLSEDMLIKLDNIKQKKLAEYELKRKELLESEAIKAKKSLPESKSKSTLRDSIKQAVQAKPVQSTVIPTPSEKLTVSEQITKKLTELVNETNITFAVKESEKRNLVVRFSSAHQQIKELAKLVGDNSKIKNDGPHYRKNNVAEYEISGKDTLVLTLLENNVFLRKFKEQMSISSADSSPKKEDKSAAIQTSRHTPKNPVSVPAKERETWEKIIHSAFCFAKEIDIKWNESQKCFVVDFSQQATWSCLPYKGKSDEYQSFNINDEIIKNQMISRLQDHLKEDVAKIELIGTQLKITPYTKTVMYQADLHEKIFNFLKKQLSNDKTEPKKSTTNKNVNNNNAINETETDDQKLKATVSAEMSNVNNNNETSTNDQPLAEAEDITSEAQQKDDNNNNTNTNSNTIPFVDTLSSKELIQQLLNMILTEVDAADFKSFAIERTKSKQWSVKLASGADSIHIKGRNPIDSVIFLEAINSYFSQFPDFMRFFPNPPRLIINPTMLKEVTQAMKNANPFLNVLNSFLDKEDDLPKESGSQYVKEEFEDKREDKTIEKQTNVSSLLKTSFNNLNAKKRENLNYHLSELQKIPAPNAILTPDDQVNYYCFLVHVLGIMRILSSGTGKEDNLFNDWRNIIRHASTQLEWTDFYKLMQPFTTVVDLIISPSKDNQLFIKPSIKSEETIQNLATKLAKFKPDLEQRTLGHGKKLPITTYKTLLAQMLAEKKDLSQNEQMAILMLCSLIGKQTGQEPYLTIHQRLGHINLDAQFEKEISELFETHRDELLKLHNNVEVKSVPGITL